MQVCRICLDINTNLYDMNGHNLRISYERLTNKFLTNDGLPWKLCWECKHRLRTCDLFRSKALRCQALLTALAPFDKHNLTQKIQSIDRKKHDLVSSLKHKNIFNDIQLYESNEDEEKLAQEIQQVNVSEIISDNENFNDVHFDLETSSDELLVNHKTKKVKKVKKTKETKIDRRRKPANEVLNEEVFSVIDLSFDEQIEEIKKRKDSANYRNSVFKCDDCFKGFLDEDAYNGHVIRHTDQSGHYVCEICKIHFKQQHSLRNHVASHLQKFSCKCCPFVTTRRHAAKLHEEWHNGTRYQCPHCQEDFVKFSTYMGHIRIKHPSDFVCDQCGYSFVSEKGLSLHKKLKHRFQQQPVLENSPYCQQCDVRFANQDALEKHIKLSARHSNDADVKQDGGRKRGERGAGGAPRRPRGKPEGPIPCEQCSMQLPDSLSYYRHFRRAHPDKNRTNYPSMKTKCMCEVCGKMFQSLALLQDHSYTHTDAKLFKCQQCDKTFQRKYRLIAHRRLHRPTRAAHACTACGKRFTTASNRQRHMFSHTGLKPFKCEMCGKCFKHASEKRAHITYVHLKKPWPKRARGKRRPDTRQVQQTSQILPPPEVDLVQPLWPACNDPKIDHMVDKPMYIL